LIVVGVIVGAVLRGTRDRLPATEATGAFGDIAAVVIASGGSWEMPASYPNPSFFERQERFAGGEVRSCCGAQCVYFGEF
jgi:hypothetical protein